MEKETIINNIISSTPITYNDGDLIGSVLSCQTCRLERKCTPKAYFCYYCTKLICMLCASEHHSKTKCNLPPNKKVLTYQDQVYLQKYFLEQYDNFLESIKNKK